MPSIVMPCPDGLLRSPALHTPICSQPQDLSEEPSMLPKLAPATSGIQALQTNSLSNVLYHTWPFCCSLNMRSPALLRTSGLTATLNPQICHDLPFHLTRALFRHHLFQEALSDHLLSGHFCVSKYRPLPRVLTEGTHSLPGLWPLYAP